MTDRLRLYVMLAVLTLLWGLAFVAIKEALEDLSPSTLTVLRFAIADACLLIVLAVRPSTRPRFARGDVWRLVVLGLAGVPAYHLLLNWGEHRTTASVASLIIATAPVLVALGSAALLRERSTTRRWVGIGLAFGGVAILAASDRGGGGSTAVVGALATFGASVSWAGYTIVAKPVAERATAVQVTAASMLIGSAGLVPFLSSQTFEEIASLPPAGWGWMVLLGVGSSVTGYFIFVWALGKMEATKVSVFLYAVPVVALLSSWLILEEDLGPNVIVAAALVITGVVLAQQDKQRAERAAESAVSTPVAPRGA